MKKLFLLLVAIATSLAFTSCQSDDSEIWDKLSEIELEELCKQMNTNIEALQTIVEALQNNDHVKGISPFVKEGITVGYIITFTKTQPITIYHNADGKEGNTPQIGVAKDTDGIYYWTLDGEWLLDAKGHKIKVVGTDEKNGVDGVTPQLKIENDYWYVSYDNGSTWVQLGKVTDQDGKDGSDSIFSSVTQDEDNVYFTLTDGTVITIPKGDKNNSEDEPVISDPNNPLNKHKCDSTEILYISKSCIPIELANHNGWGANLTSNTYGEDGVGRLKFDAVVRVIPYKAFYDNDQLRYIKMPNSVTEISWGAFCYCSNLTSVTIPNSVTKIESYAFDDCNSLTSVHISDLSAWCKISFESASNPLYYAKNLYLNGNLVTGLTIPSDIREIKNYAFYGFRSLTNVTIPNRVTKIGSYVFFRCSSLTSVTIPNRVTTIGSYAFKYCSSLTSITIPNSVTKIGKYAFEYCSGELIINSKTLVQKDYTHDNSPTNSNSGWLNGNKFTKLTIGDNITTIGNFAFCDCSSLTSVTIPNSITSIRERAFYDCSSLTNITIPNSVTQIGEEAFCRCSSLTSVYCKPTTPPTGGDYMFYSNASGRTIYVPSASVDAYKAAWSWSNYKSSIKGYDF